MIRRYEPRDEDAVWLLIERRHAEKFARSAGYEKIWLDSSRKLAAARKLYEKNLTPGLRDLAG